jgi:hypothetical protein
MVAENIAAVRCACEASLPRTRVPAPRAIPAMRAFLLLLFAIPRLAVLVWLVIGTGWPAPPLGVAVGIAGLLFAPFTALALVITLVGGVEPLDWLVVCLAAVSDVLTWITRQFERGHGRPARAGRESWRDGVGSGPSARCPSRSVPEQWFDVLAMALPWPGMRLQATLRRWPRRCEISSTDERLLCFLAYDSTARAIFFSTPAWIAGIFSLAVVVNNSELDWPMRMAVAMVGPVLTIGLIQFVGAQNAQFRVVLPITKALRVLYCSTTCPLTTREVRQLNRHIARTADALQRLPLRLHSSYPQVLREAAEKAAAMSALQEVVTSGAPDTVEQLRTRLRADLSLVLEGQWRSLRGDRAVDRVQGLTHWQKAGYVAVAAALVCGAAWIGTGSTAWGQAAGPVIAAMVGLAMAALIRSGVAPGGLQQAIDLGKGAIEIKDAAPDSRPVTRIPYRGELGPRTGIPRRRP